MRHAYDLETPNWNKRLTETGRGTPMGELLRRYWHPIGLSADATSKPRQIGVLAEDLILFRDGQGRPGLLHPRCAHSDQLHLVEVHIFNFEQPMPSDSVWH